MKLRKYTIGFFAGSIAYGITIALGKEHFVLSLFITFIVCLLGNFIADVICKE